VRRRGIFRQTVLTLLMTSLSVPSGAARKPSVVRVQDGLATDRLGETLRQYRARYPQTECNREHGVWDAANSKRTWALWVHCSVREAVTVGGYPLLSSISPQYPFGATTTFYDGRLVEVTYALSAPSPSALIPAITKLCGQPSYLSKAQDGEVVLATWVLHPTGTARVERLPVHAISARPGTIRISDTPLTFVVTLRISIGWDRDTEN